MITFNTHSGTVKYLAKVNTFLYENTQLTNVCMCICNSLIDEKWIDNKIMIKTINMIVLNLLLIHTKGNVTR